ncbi:5962_t:CDS:2 [Acaulospora morrowiae]|uniref:5962_t:CDS:1 n=1 Tax=Acaulospora morrowiae TaxID=94023 RepID=A0A9N8YQS8_9GLOM|nr:5962_t:CDS:2 [Acaulospora morrowiae]
MNTVIPSGSDLFPLTLYSFYLVSSPLQDSGRAFTIMTNNETTNKQTNSQIQDNVQEDSQAQNNTEGDPQAQSDQDDSLEKDIRSLWNQPAKWQNYKQHYKENIHT